MRMTEALAGAVAVSIPIFALAAGAEARTLREWLKRAEPIAQRFGDGNQWAASP